MFLWRVFKRPTLPKGGSNSDLRRQQARRIVDSYPELYTGEGIVLSSFAKEGYSSIL
jgi:hypothetical protein